RTPWSARRFIWISPDGGAAARPVFQTPAGAWPRDGFLEPGLFESGCMKDKVLPPYIIWLGVWLAMLIAILVIGSWQDNLGRQEALAKSGQRELAGICSIFPYA